MYSIINSVPLFMALFMVTAASEARAQSVLGTYDFAGVTTSSGTSDPSTVPTATGLTFGSFSAVGYTGSSTAAGRFSLIGNPTGSANGVNDFTTFTGSLNPAIYYTVTLTPQAGYTLNLDSVTFTAQRSGTGIRNYAVRASLDSYADNLAGSISPANANLSVDVANNFRWLLDAQTGAQSGSLLTLGSAFDSVTSAVTFHFYGWNAEASTGSFSIDNVSFTGAVTLVPVPEPSTVALAAAGGFALLFAYRRRR